MSDTRTPRDGRDGRNLRDLRDLPDPRDELEVEALRTDRYLEALLAAVDRRAPATPADAALDPAIRAAATNLAHELSRVHPSFRFEERLAARLNELARSMRLAPAAGGDAVPIPLPGAQVDPDALDDDTLDLLAGLDPLDPDPDAVAAAVAADPELRALRPLLIGGALTSAALSLAGAAWVAWRHARPPARSPMARAVRAARHARGTRPGRGSRLPRVLGGAG